jgi:hypothetical protein
MIAPVAFAALALAGAACRASLGPTFSAGSVAVPGTATGFAGGVDGEVQIGGDFAVAVTADLAGYPSAGDGDPIFWTEAQLRYRLPIHDAPTWRVFGTVGVGPGLVVCCYLDAAVAGGFVELAIERRFGRALIGASLRERPAYFMTGGDPFGEIHTTIGLALTLGWASR